MSAIDKVRSFAEAREEHDESPIRDGLTYGDARELLRRLDLLLEALYGMACQHCRGSWPADEKSQHFGTNACSADAEALLVLAELGVVRLVGEPVGRAVEAADTEPPYEWP